MAIISTRCPPKWEFYCFDRHSPWLYLCWIVSFCNADLSVFHRENFEIIVSSDERFLLLEFTIVLRSYINIVMGIDTKLKSGSRRSSVFLHLRRAARFGTINACNFTKCNTPPWVFFTFFKLYKWNQIAQSMTFVE